MSRETADGTKKDALKAMALKETEADLRAPWH